MRSGIGVLKPYGLWLLCGFLGLFVVLHVKVSLGALGVLGRAPVWYLQTTAGFNPFQVFNETYSFGPLNLPRVGRLLALLVLFGGYIQALRRVRHESSGAYSLRQLLVGVVLFSVPLLLLPFILSSDVYSYIFYGRLTALYGANPMLVTPRMYANDPFFNYISDWTDTASTYGPLWTMLSHGLTLIVERGGGAVWLYLLAYKLLVLGGHLLNVVLLWILLGRWKPRQQLAGTLLYAWNPLALIEFAGSAHNDALMLTGILIALLFAQRGAWRRAIVALVLAALVKWIAIVLLPLYGLMLFRQRATWSGRVLLVVQATVLALGCAVVFYAPYWGGGRVVAALTAAPAATLWHNSIPAEVVQQVPYVLHSLGYGPDPRPAANKALILEERRELALVVGLFSRGVVALAMLIGLYAIWRRPTFEQFVRSSFWLLFVTLVVALWFWPWYLTWLLPLAALLEWRRAGLITITFTATASMMYVLLKGRAYFIFVPVLVLLAYMLWQQYRQGRSRRDVDHANELPLTPEARVHPG